VWKAAHRLIDYLEATGDETGLSKPGVNILELGSGTGWMGMVLAQNLQEAKTVCMTEMEAGVGLYKLNAVDP
jgi:cyclopropane fatty-acyl-phospholipid synthase-like methyltransferase